MKSFLNAVAAYLFKNHVNDFKDIVVVFPNRRSGVFFLEELKKQVQDKPFWSPKVVGINEFVARYTELMLAENVQLLSELYLAYRQLSNSFENFDDFYSWGEVLLADFNDVDKYNVEAQSVFVNVKEFKSIENPLGIFTDEQREVLERFFGTLDLADNSKIQSEFLKIWELMHPLYDKFKVELRKKKMAYEGMIYQDAMRELEKKEAADFSFKKVCFVGFNAITPIEEQIFSHFKNIGLAQFYWDYDDCYINNKAMEAGLFLRKYIAKFPPEKLNKNFAQLKGKHINVIAASTDHGQVFELNSVLNKLEIDDPKDTAIVLSDEQMLMPVVNQIPQKIDHVNITMGYPLGDSLCGNFIELLVQLQVNGRKSDEKGGVFYYRQVQSLMRHPFLQIINPNEAGQINERITNENLYNLNSSELGLSEFLKQLFVFSDSFQASAEYFEQVLGEVHGYLIESQSDDQGLLLEIEFLFASYLEIKKFNAQIRSYELKLKLPTYFGLLRKVLRSLIVPFEGEPVTGLQVMGFLETRNLDFKNVIVTSVNEGVIPVQARSASFIPYSLRRGFGLPTGELNDAMYAYYFYRLLQSAENVWLIYNSGVGGMSTGERSRLIYQLEFDPNFKVNAKAVSQSVEVVADKEIQIEKTGEVWERLCGFIGGENSKILSPSALSVYIQCKLRFYFKSVARVREADEVEEVVDARIFGNIFHKAAELVYADYFKNNALVTKQELKRIAAGNEYLNEILVKSFSQVFYGDKTSRVFKVEGKNQLVYNVIMKYLLRMLEADSKVAPFSIVGLEKNVSEMVEFELNGQKMKVRLGGQVDRLDRTDEALRVIDYKTGSDKLTFIHINDVFDPDFIKDTKAVFQTFVYSYLLSKEYASELCVKPMVYQVKNLFDPKAAFSIVSTKYTPYKSGNFLDIAGEVELHLKELLAELFDKNKPFAQTENLNSCKNCPYKSMCGR